MRWLISLVTLGFLAFQGTASADIWIRGHGDLGVALVNNQLELHLHFADAVQGAAGTIAAGEYTPSDHIIGVPNPAVPRPAGNQWDFLGTAGSVWFLPQSVDNNKPFLGFGLEELVGPVNGNWNGPLTWSLNSVVASPAGSNFSLWSESLGNPTVRMATSDGVTAADSFTQLAGGHEHFNLGFTQEGTYQISFRIQGVHNTLGSLSDTATFTFQVGNISAVPEPSTALAITAIFGMVGIYRIRRSGRLIPFK